MPEGISWHQVIQVTGINTKVTGQTVLFTPQERSFMVTALRLRCTAATSITVAATGSAGQNASTWNDICPSSLFSGLLAAGKYYSLPLVANPVVVAPGSTIELNITVPASGTSQTIDAILEGYHVV